MRSDPERLRFEIVARDGAARTGRLHTPSGVVETPAFIPLATRGSVRSLTAAEVAALGFQMVLGNTFHLMLSPGAGGEGLVRPRSESIRIHLSDVDCLDTGPLPYRPNAAPHWRTGLGDLVAGVA